MGDTFLAPTASPVYKATNPVPQPVDVRASSNLRPSEVGMSLKHRLSCDGHIGTEEVTVIATTGVKVSQPKSDTFKARFAEYRNKPDVNPEDTEGAAAAEKAGKAGKKKKHGRLNRWVRFF